MKLEEETETKFVIRISEKPEVSERFRKKYALEGLEYEPPGVRYLQFDTSFDRSSVEANFSAFLKGVIVSPEGRLLAEMKEMQLSTFEGADFELIEVVTSTYKKVVAVWNGETFVERETQTEEETSFTQKTGLTLSKL